MKTLHLLRHAKSSWDQPGVTDHERVLNQRGERDARRMGAALADQLAPLRITASSARRAQLTLAGLAAGWPALAALSHQSDPDLYTFSSEDLLAWLERRGDRRDALFIIGHNPALTDLVNQLCWRQRLPHLPTAGYVRLSLSINSWALLRSEPAQLEASLFPKELPAN